MSQTDHAFDRDGYQIAVGSRVLLVEAPTLTWVVGRIGPVMPSGAKQLWLTRPGMDVTRTAAPADVLHAATAGPLGHCLECSAVVAPTSRAASGAWLYEHCTNGWGAA